MKTTKSIMTFNNRYGGFPRWVLLLLNVFAVNLAHGDSTHCQTTNAALDAMPAVSVTLTRQDGTQHNLMAKLADNSTTRAAGFQRVCESTIVRTPILFTFAREQVPSFHMNNVVAPIDIAFIRK